MHRLMILLLLFFGGGRAAFAAPQVSSSKQKTIESAPVPGFQLVRGRDPLPSIEFELGPWMGRWSAPQKAEQPQLGAQASLIVKLKGAFRLENSALLRGVDPVKTDPKTGKFEIEVRIQAEETQFELKQVGADGSVRTEEFALRAPNWAQLKLLVLKAEGEKKSASAKPSGVFSGGLGVALLDYRQTGVESFSQTGLSGKIAYSRWIFGHSWALDVNAYGTLLPISRRSDGVWVRQLGTNLRLGKRIWSAGPQWDLWVSGGMFGAWAIASDSSFGFKNLVSAQLYPVLSYRPSSQNRFSTYLKWVPLFGLSQRELAVGFHWKRKRKSWGDWLLGVDFSDIYFKPSATTELNARNIVLGFGISQ
ncbi:MAG: hypothetical protein ACK5QT_00965 [Oligoflexia bacterium]